METSSAKEELKSKTNSQADRARLLLSVAINMSAKMFCKQTIRRDIAVAADKNLPSEFAPTYIPAFAGGNEAQGWAVI